MIMKNEKKARVKGQASMEFNDYFAAYLVQWEKWQYRNRHRGLKEFGRNFGP